MLILFTTIYFHFPAGSPGSHRAEGTLGGAPGACAELASESDAQGVVTDGRAAVSAGFAPNMNTDEMKDFTSSLLRQDFPYLAEGLRLLLAEWRFQPIKG